MIIIIFKGYQIDSRQGSEKYEQPIKGNKKFDTFNNWDKKSIKNSEYIALFPNVMIGLHIDHFYVFWLGATCNK